MGNEESQPGGAPGQPQQGAPGGFGMGPPQQQPRFGGPQAGPPPGMRQVAPTGRPPLRPGGPGPPQPTMRGAFPGGTGTVPRAAQPGGPVRPVQVGVQPWAGPPVQQPPPFRGPSSQPQRPQLQQQQPMPQQQQQATVKQQQQEAEMDVGLDLSNLSEEEKAKILSVMARAQDLDHDYERQKRAKEDPTEVRPQLLCPLCQAADLNVETNKMCGDCGKNFCQKCGTFVPGEGRRSVWVCNTCSNRRKQQEKTTAAHQKDMMDGQKVAGDPGSGRKDGTMSRMGQPFQTQQQQQQATAMAPGGQQQGQQQGALGQPSVSLLGGSGGTGSSGVTGVMSGSLIPSSAVGRGAGTIPGTVPLSAAVSQQQWPGVVTVPATQQQQQWNLQQTSMQQPFLQQGGGQQQPMDVMVMKKGVESSDWSPVTDLSPIMDVSPSLGAAERGLMEKCVAQQEQLRPGGIPRAQSGTISSLLADFNKSVGQTTPTLDDGRQQRSLGIAPPQQQQLGTTTAQQKTTAHTGGTEMDQNQNLVQQHQFQLQQQQLMIQQQQQVIQQQQQQLQQQMQQQQIQTQQQQQVQLMQDMQQQQQNVTGSLVQQQPGVVMGGTPMQQQTPSQRKDQVMDTISLVGEGDKKVGRRLPPVPLDQEPATAPLRRTKDRSRTLSMPMSTSADRGAWDGARRMPQRTTSLDDGMSLTRALASTTSSSILDTLGLTSSSTDTYLKLMAAGLLGTTTTTTTATKPTSILDSIPSSIPGLNTTMSLLGRRDLSAPHSLSLYREPYHLDSEAPKLPSYLLSLKQQLREGLRSVSTAEHNRRRITDPDLSGLLSHSAWGSLDSSYDPLRKLGPSSATSTLPLTGSRMAAAGGRRSRHRRHASDTKLSTFASLGRDELQLDDPLSRYKLYQGGSTMPFKSYEFESIDDHLGPSYATRVYPRGSSLTDMRLTADPLRDTAVGSSLASAKDRRYNREIARLRRHTDTGLGSLGLSGLDPYGRGGRGRVAPRSWHPSPYVSEDEDEREEKKAKIKAEIARRRQHIEENARLHHHHHHHFQQDDDPYRRRGGDPLAGYPLWDRLYSSPLSLEGVDTEDLMTVRRDAYSNHRNHGYMSSTYPAYRNTAAAQRYNESRGGGWPYDPYAYADDLADPYDLDAYSPVLDPSEQLLAPMPLLPDMPTRSRRLLHDLGSAPISTHNHSRSGVSSQPYDEYEGRRGGPEDTRGRSVDTNHHHQHHPQHHSSPSGRKAQQQQQQAGPKYEFPVKRILLTRDPKDRSVSGNGLGMKVVGGKEIPGGGGEIGAYVARIYPGGVVETLGEVREGDQVLEWNGTSLTGKTYEEVQRIIATSGDEVEIVIRSDFNMLTPRSSSHQHHNRHPHHEQQHHPSGEPRLSRRSGHRPSDGSYQHGHQQQQSSSYRTARGYRNYDGDYPRSPTEEGMRNCGDPERSGSPYRSSPTGQQQRRIGSPTGKADTTDNKEKYRAENISGEIQLQVCYDSKASILYVTVVRARNLVTSRDNSGLPDPYVKCYLLPDRRVENQRRTRYFARCSDPEWKQTMVYPQVPQDQLRKKHLEVSVWNYDVARPPEFLGEVILDLKDTSVIDEQSRWYKLHPHDPKKYPSQSTLNNEGAVKMARLNNPNKTANALYLDNDDIRKQQHTA